MSTLHSITNQATDAKVTVPEGLRALATYKQWILCKGKVPISPTTNAPINPHNPANWMSAADAYARAASTGLGVGFVFTADIQKWFLDIDKCYTPEAGWSPLATELCAKFPGAAVEVSQSGRGLHIFGSGPVPPHGCRNTAEGLELYTEKRFVALSTNPVRGDAATVHTAAIADVVAQHFPPGAAKSEGAPAEWTSEPVPEWRGPDDDDELIRRMLASKSASGAFNGKASLAALWNADAEALARVFPPTGEGEYDASAADAALCTHLAFWAGKDCERIDRLVRRSALYREKWEREDYRTNTILGAVTVCREVYGARVAEGQDNETKSDFRFISLAENQSRLSGAVWLIPPYLERNITAVMFGESGLYKSFVALDLGLCVAYGQEYHGHRSHQGAVYYLCGEGKGGIARRVEAWRLEHELQHKDAPFYVSEIPAQLLDEGNAQDVAFAMEKPVLVIIDTLSTNIGEGDENSNADVGRVLVNVGRYIRDAHGACVLLVHHVGHGDKDRERGAYALRGNADTRVQIKPYKDGCSLHSLKVKDGAPFQPIAFEPQTVVIPGILDSEGDVVTSLTMGQVEYIEPTLEAALPHQQAQALAVLKDIAPATPADWRNKLISLQVIKCQPKYARQAVSRLKQKLIQAGMVVDTCGLLKPVEIEADEKA